MGKRRVIIVERDADALCSLVGGLEGEFAILGLRSPEAALRASPELYDAILLGVAEDGWQALTFTRELRAKLITTPVVFAAANPEMAIVAEQASAFAFLPKPIDERAVARVLRLAVEAIGALTAWSTPNSRQNGMERADPAAATS
jgi:CheY-like chemotaxis protein